MLKVEAREVYATTAADTARFFGVAVPTVDKWRAKNGFPTKTAKGYPLGEIVRWRRGLHEPKTNESARDRLDRLKGDKAELELARERGEVVGREEVIRDFRQACSLLRAVCDSIPHALLAVTPEKLRKSHRIVLGQKMSEIYGSFQELPEKWNPQKESKSKSKKSRKKSSA